MKSEIRNSILLIPALIAVLGAGTLTMARGLDNLTPARFAASPEAAAGDSAALGAPGSGLRASAPMTTATASPPITPTATMTGTELLPDLVIQSFGWQYVDFDKTGCMPESQKKEFLVRIANIGEAPAGPFEVRVVDFVWPVAGLAEGETLVLKSESWPMTADFDLIIDPDNEVRESNEDNNVLRAMGGTPTPLSTPPPVCTAPPTITPSPTPTRSAYVPFAVQRMNKDDLPELPLVFRPRTMARLLRLPTLDGTLGILPGDPGDESYVFIGRHPRSLLSQKIWDASAEMLFETSPRDAHYVFMAYEETAAGSEDLVRQQKARMDAALEALEPADRAHWQEHLHYVSVNPMSLGGWFPQMLEGWGSSNPLAVVSWNEAGEPVELTLDTTADSGWAPRIGPDHPLAGEIAWFGTACNGEPAAQNVAGKLALIERGVCAFTEKVANAERLGATGVVMFTDDRPKTEMAGSCEPCPMIPAIMIDREPGLRMKEQAEDGNAVTVVVENFWAQAHAFAIDHRGLLREFGWIPYGFPTFHEHQFDLFEQIAFEAQAYHYEYEQASRMEAEEAAGEVKVIPVFEDVLASDPGWTGRRFIAEIELPSAEEMKGYDKLEVDLAMGCRFGEDDRCGAWDYLTYLYLCDDLENPNRCNNEIGRFITAYKRQTHWVTDISPMLGYFQEGGTVRLGFWTVQPYVLDMNLRLSKSEEAKAAGGANLVPSQLLPLFGGGRFDRRFDENYNEIFQPITFTVPTGVQKVELVTIISGHGFDVDTQQCAEFCNHTHDFGINGQARAVYIEHGIMDDPVGADIGCALQIPLGVAPNQFGTWPFGRAAWCPGLDVPPKRFDITDKIEIGGADNVITYFGGFRGEPYVPVKRSGQEGAGWDMRIEMKSFLLYWTAP
jgi:hypothetical protein